MATVIGYNVRLTGTVLVNLADLVDVAFTLRVDVDVALYTYTWETAKFGIEVYALYTVEVEVTVYVVFGPVAGAAASSV